MKLSIIIPMGRPETATATIRSIFDQTYLPENLEIIIVGVKAEEMAVLYNREFLIPIVLEKNLSPPKTRMAGVSRAKGDWFLFVDDDVELDRVFLERVAKILKEEANLGAIGVRLPGKDNTYFSKVTDLANFWSQQCPKSGHRDWLYSAAIVVSSKAYHEVGGFDSRLPNAEDVDLTQRIRQVGYQILYRSDLIAYHNHRRTDLKKTIAYFWYSGNTAMYFFQNNALRLFNPAFLIKSTRQHTKDTIRLNQAEYPNFWYYLPGMIFMYLVFNISSEFHRHKYLIQNVGYPSLQAQNNSQRDFLKALQKFKQSKKLQGTWYYIQAYLRNLLARVQSPLKRFKGNS